jgi:hypothetical protein
MLRPLLVAVALCLLPAGAAAEGAESVRWLGVQGRNAQVELTVFDLASHALRATPERQRVELATAWRNIAPPERMGEIEWKTSGVGGLASFGRARPPRGREAVRHTAYLVPRVGDHVYLAYGSGRIARVAEAFAADDGAEEEGAEEESGPEREIRLPRQNDEVEWLARFEIDRDAAGAMALVFLDFDHGHINVPLTATAPLREGVGAQAEAANDYVRVRAYAVQARGDELEVELGLLSNDEGSVVDVALDDAFRLRSADGGVHTPAALWPDEWVGETVRILPEWEQRARLRFEDVGDPGPSVLEVHLPGVEVLELPLAAVRRSQGSSRR